MEPSLSNIEKQEQAALRIQKLWRSYTNRKIYKYYKEIIFFKCRGNPAKLLRGINPAEAKLLEASVDCHVRFKLGGDSFPPNIYYKIFAKSRVCDINAFAPRDYSALPRDYLSQNYPKVTRSEYEQDRKKYESAGWYLRNDQNGWRPISHKMFIKTDYVQLHSAKKVHFYHHKKVVRDQKYYKKQRLAKLKWMRNLYMKAQQTEEVELIDNMKEAEQNDQGLEFATSLAEEKEALKAQLEAKEFDLESQELDKEITELVEWSQDLNFDAYVKDWYILSTSESSANFVPKFVNAHYKIE